MGYCRRFVPPLGLLLVLAFIPGGCAGPTRTDFPQPPDLVILVDRGLWRYPAWSPTGSEIAFLYAGWPPSALLRVDVPTGTLVTLVGARELLTKTVAQVGTWGPSRYLDGPAWSPQGDRIAFVYHETEFKDEMYVVGRDGSGLTRLGEEWWDPAWSPDGQWIAFSRPGEGIYVVHPDGTSEKQLTHGHDSTPAWSPDGSRIAFVSERDGNQEIHVVNADGSGERNLTQNAATDWQPAWSPDGSRIAFGSFRDDGLGIYTMAPDGSGQVAVTKDGGLSPTWSPDGRRIAFCDIGLYVVGAGGGNRRLVASPADCTPNEFTWSPDGEQIAFMCDREDFMHPGLMLGSWIYLVRVGP